MAGFTDYFENMLIDGIFRGQTLTVPAALYMALFTAAPSDAGGGTEVTTGKNYARVQIAQSLTAFAGTQSAGSTSASSGTSGTTSNNGTVTYGAPSADWGVVSHWGLFDASTSGHLICWGALGTNKTINNGDSAPSFAAAAFTYTID